MQFELAGRLGPEPGRYVLRRYAGDDARHVLVLATAAAPTRRRRLGGRRAKAVAPEQPPGEVEVTRATVVDAEPIAGGPVAGDAWLAQAAGADAPAVVAQALEVLNRALAAHRLAAADPHVVEIGPRAALVTRVGYGTGEQVAEGRWLAARELAAPQAPRRSAALRPQERLAALLSGRDAALACEELALRARSDLDHGREREAALQLRAALEAALAELEGWRANEGMAARLDELAGHRAAVEAAAAAALEGGLQPEEREAVAAALGRLEAALRARTAAAQW